MRKILTVVLSISFLIASIFIINKYESKKRVYKTINYKEQPKKMAFMEHLHKIRANQYTNTVDPKDVYKVKQEIKNLNKFSKRTAIGLNWNFMGPDNIGGRTRSFLIDKNNSNIFITGGVSGGIFVSTNSGIIWEPIQTNDIEINQSISGLTQTENGRIFFSTGATYENPNGTQSSGSIGGGIFELDVANKTITPIIKSNTAPNTTTSDNLSFVNSITSTKNTLIIGTARGCRYAELKNGNYPNNFNQWSILIPSRRNVFCHFIDVAANGSVLVTLSNGIWRADNIKSNFSSILSFTGNVGRAKAKIAPSNPNIIYNLTVTSSGCLNKIEVTEDKGANWTTLVTGTGNVARKGEFDPFSNPGTNCQGVYDMALGINPKNSGHIVIGGVSLYEWIKTSSNPISGGFTRIANNFSRGVSYVHSDVHYAYWRDSSTLFVTTDGGIFQGTRNATNQFSWAALNYNLNITQFYDIDYNAQGTVAGGAQDNGSIAVFSDEKLRKSSFISTPKGGSQFNGGDGFATKLSEIPGIVAFASIYNGNITRFVGNSTQITRSTIFDTELETACENGCGSFYTSFDLWETTESNNSIDSVVYKFKSDTTLNANDTLFYKSNTNNIKLSHIFLKQQKFLANDSIKLMDSIQSKFVFSIQGGGKSGLWMTRQASNVSVPNPEWSLIANSSQSSPDNFFGQCFRMAFSKDGNHLFAGTSTGSLYRISNLNLAKNDANTDVRNGNSVLTCTRIGVFSGRFITSIAIDPKNTNNIIVTLGNYSNSTYVYRSTSALSATSSSNSSNFEAIQGPTASSAKGYLPKMPVHSSVISYAEKNYAIIGTEFGAFSTTNAFASNPNSVEWYDETLKSDMTYIPIFKIVQNTFPWRKSHFTGYYYLGTHGRGIFSAKPKKGIKENEYSSANISKPNFFSNLKVYPNPLVKRGNISFNMLKSDNLILTAYDMLGRKILEKKLGRRPSGHNIIKDFEVSNFERGIYIINIKSLRTGLSTSSKFIISNN